MKIWLPDSLYRVKPLLLMLFGAALLFITDAILPIILACFCLGYGSWILVIRIMWSNTDMIKTRVGSRMAGEHKTHQVNM